MKEWPDNVWMGTSVENQEYADKRLPDLLGIPAIVRFVSYEPALGEVNFMPYIHGIHWLICGGESGPQHRPFDLNWARSARDQVRVADGQGYDCRFFYKQQGGITHSAGGRILDGSEWNEIPPEFPGGANKLCKS
jgi:protein gp37